MLTFTASIVLYFMCLRVLCTRSSQQSAKARWDKSHHTVLFAASILTSTSWLLAISSTIQIAICFAQSAVFLATNMHGFVTLDGGPRGAAYFARNNSPLSIAQECLYTINVRYVSKRLVFRTY